MKLTEAVFIYFIYLVFMDYLTILSVAQVLSHHMLVNNELEGM